MEERRKFVRIPEQLEITYRILHDKNIKTFITKDISQVGIKFLSSDVIPKDSLLQIRLNFPKTHFSFEAIVKVKWIVKEAHSDRYDVGAEFVDLTMEATENLLNYISNYLKDTKIDKRGFKFGA